jgi:phosphate-selective porin OprO/OprP
MKKLYLATTALLAATGVNMTPAFAADSTDKQIKMLQQQLQALQQQLNALQSSTADQQAKLDAEVAKRQKAEKDATEAAMEAGGKMVFVNGEQKVLPPANPKVVESSAHKFSLSSADGKWTIAPTGRLHFDMGGYFNQKSDLATGPLTTAGGRLQGGVNVRRARLGFQGKAMGDFEWSLIADVGGTNDGAFLASTPGTANGLLNQAKLSYMGIKNTALEIGYFASFMTLDEATSSNDIMFIERATPATVAAAVAAGDPRAQVGFRTWSNRYWVGAYLTSSAPGDSHALANTRRLGGYARATYQLLADEFATFHIGGDVSTTFKIPTTGAGTAPTITLSDRPELRIDTTALLSTGALGTVANPLKDITTYGLEAAGTWNNFYFQGEYFWTDVTRLGRPKATFDGGYLQASYTLGGRRTYKAAEGVYSGVTPIENFSPHDGTWGAFEIAARLSQMDLTEGRYTPSLTAAAQPGVVNGGRQTNMTVGLNWIWNSYMLWKFNYIHAHIDRTNPTVTVGGPGIKADLETDAVGVRFQIAY